MENKITQNSYFCYKCKQKRRFLLPSWRCSKCNGLFKQTEKGEKARVGK